MFMLKIFFFCQKNTIKLTFMSNFFVFEKKSLSLQIIFMEKCKEIKTTINSLNIIY